MLLVLKKIPLSILYYNDIKSQHIAVITEQSVWISCLNVHRQSWTKVVRGRGSVWSGIPSSSLGSCGLGWSSLRSQSSLLRMPKPWTPTTLMLKLSSTRLTRSEFTLCCLRFETTAVLQGQWTCTFFPFTLLVTSSKAPKETLTCILDCMAHMLTIPEEVENAFLDRTIKAFTWVRKTIHLIICTLFQLLH